MAEIRNILVHLEGAERAQQRLHLAHRLALAQRASVTVVHAPLPSSAILPYAGASGAVAAQALVEMEEQRRRDARSALELVMAETGLRAEWIELDDDAGFGIATVLGRRAMYADLLVLGQHDPASAGPESAGFGEALLARSGRPAVLVPFAGEPPGSFKRMAIAWKEEPEAARAVASALPLLRLATEVHVLSWGGEPAQWRTSLQQYLRAHEVEPIWHDGGPEPEYMGEILLSRVADLSCDMLVMGCYGHSRAREWLLGGASRTVLSSMTLPVFMAH